jgi:hypothetical protein
MKILIFTPCLRLEPETIDSILHQINIEMHSVDVMFTHDNPFEQGSRNVSYNYNKMRRIVLEEEYDKVWICESDIIPQKNALSKLLLIDTPIATGFYLLRHGTPSPNLMVRDTISIHWKKLQDNWNKVIEVAGGCMGCLLIDKSILEQYTFEYDDKIPPDSPFMFWCQKNMIKQKADLSVICGHKRPDGKIIYPDYNKDYSIV